MTFFCWITLYLSQSVGSVDRELDQVQADVCNIIWFVLSGIIIVEIMDLHGAFRLLKKGIRVTTKKALLVAVAGITFVVSSFLDNMTTVIGMISLLRSILPVREDRLMFGSAVVVVSNVGGCWNPMGDVTSTMLWIGGELTALGMMRSLFIPAIFNILVSIAAMSFFVSGPVEVNAPPKAGSLTRRVVKTRDRSLLPVDGLPLEPTTLTSPRSRIRSIYSRVRQAVGLSSENEQSLTPRSTSSTTGVMLLDIGTPSKKRLEKIPMLSAEDDEPSPLAMSRGDRTLSSSDKDVVPILSLQGEPEVSYEKEFVQFDKEPGVDEDVVEPVTLSSTVTLEPHAWKVLAAGAFGLLCPPILNALTGLPPFMGRLLGLGLMWIVTDYAHMRHKERERLRMLHAFSTIDLSSIFFFFGILWAVNSLTWAGLLKKFSTLLSDKVPFPPAVALIIGFISSIMDNVPLVAAAQGMYSLDQYPINHPFWVMVCYCAGTGGSILIMGSAAGVALMGLEKVDFFWYLKRVSLIAMLGYLFGFGVYMLQFKLFGF
eukprot:CAMPEP_0184348460 /NCGR_PEP_ID=MMETSP1089-20130417/27657_1 /TAXON_ID=38269 ORGANISM="Gloeochaete wittrockiana, Strain SAG46.84" /NCGR_SAMPLE_ID=MMETSP1089 /ASSEMBLY_ACC=CAM_ASM_000445 /LENGTH=540 /DNA_ID=CAMNT_0026680177 /DNA_START=406 /DNA_END=2028 /DNA_ORIENTATION=-